MNNKNNPCIEPYTNILHKENGWFNVEAIPSNNYNQRPIEIPISLVVIHNISLPPEEFNNQQNKYIDDFFTNNLDISKHSYFAEIAGLKVSSHFLIERNGYIKQFVSSYNRAWHAGTSCFNNISNCNDYSIGIELEGSDNQPFTLEQYNNLTLLLQCLQTVHLDLKYITSHSYISPQRKTDPGINFDWDILHTANLNYIIQI